MGPLAPSVSIVVPTYDRRASLARLLAGLEAQTLTAQMEVVVVDDGSRDGTREWLRDARFTYDLRFFRQANAGPAAARNRGVAEARAELIVFLDDDVVPDPGLVAAHVAAHQATPNSVVCGPMLPPDGWRRPAWIRWEEEKLLEQYRAMRDGVYPCTYRQLFTGNASLPRERFVAAGGFDTTFTRAEDVELGFRLDGLGVRFVFEPAARVWHYPQRTFKTWRRTPYSYGHADVVMYRDKGNPVLRAAFEEFHRRHRLSRAVARQCVGRPILFPFASVALTAVARLSDVFGLRPVAAASLSGLFNLLYWQGVCDALGGPQILWSAVGDRPRSVS